MERVACGSTWLFVWRDAVPLDVVERLIAGRVTKQQVVEHEPLRAVTLRNALLPYLPEVDATWGQHVTYSCRSTPIEEHVDKDVDDNEHKLLLFADDVAGTVFRTSLDDPDDVLVEASPGTVVIFPLALPHRGAPHRDARLKRTLGLRLTLRSPL